MTVRRLQDFEGEWRLSREVVEADGRRATVTGRAVWSRAGTGLANELAYVETGEMRLPGTPPMQVERRYHWAQDLSVFFADGRFFHRVPPEGGETAHWCDPDQYDGAYDFSRWPEFTVTWAVRGPRKDYRMMTIYTPEDR
ncbi:DUF6314 family protein [Roseovarius nitratireducens]|uniref:DUF6314 family protein n=1 Tax=Roseovarius nitratireducens TaxID=2044597 RepID=UPI000CE23E17|nr:DUF6314 family protein [Roseovarius nitratireducens]